MGYSKAIWDLDDDPEGNVQHIADHDITMLAYKFSDSLSLFRDQRSQLLFEFHFASW